jgi:hypothetical protein
MRRLALLSVAAVTLFAGAAQADEAFDSFRNFCVATRAAAPSALAAADAAGWSPVPAEQLSQQSGMQNPNGRMKAAGSGALILLTADANPSQMGPSHMCMVGVVPAGASDLAGQLAAFAAVPKQTNADLPEGFYAWRDENGGHANVQGGTPDYTAQFKNGTAMVAAIRSLPQMTMIVLTTAAQ